MDIKDSYLHSTVGVVKSIETKDGKLIYTLADKKHSSVEIPTASKTTTGLVPKIPSSAYAGKVLKVNSSGEPTW
jgi:hypothetical protein